MNKPVITILVVGDNNCGKLKFIQKFLFKYPGDPLAILVCYDVYKCEGTNESFYLYSIKDKLIFEESDILSKVDMILFSHTSDKAETFRSLQQTWIPCIKEFKNSCFIIDNAIQRNTLTEEQIKLFEEKFGIVLRAAYFPEYEEVFSELENILRRKSNEILSALHVCTRGTFSENLPNLRSLSTVAPIPNVYSVTEFCPNATSTPQQSANESSSDESTVADKPTEKTSSN